MATEIEVKPALAQAGISLTQFWGGEGRGTCLQVTAQPGQVPNTIQLTRDQALELGEMLTAWAVNGGRWFKS